MLPYRFSWRRPKWLYLNPYSYYESSFQLISFKSLWLLKTNLYKILGLYHISFYCYSSNTQKYSWTFYLMIDGICFINTVIRNLFSTIQASYWDSEEQRMVQLVFLFSTISFRVGANSPVHTMQVDHCCGC